MYRDKLTYTNHRQINYLSTSNNTLVKTMSGWVSHHWAVSSILWACFHYLKIGGEDAKFPQLEALWRKIWFTRRKNVIVSIIREESPSKINPEKPLWSIIHCNHLKAAKVSMPYINIKNVYFFFPYLKANKTTLISFLGITSNLTWDMSEITQYSKALLSAIII